MSYKNYTKDFIICKYSKWYFNIIDNVLCEQRKKLPKLDPNRIYYEQHHILPESIYPEFKSIKANPWNKVLLTPKEHFIVHLLLTKCFASIRNQKKMYHALKMFRMNGNNQERNTTSGQYSLMKIAASKSSIGVPRSKETIKKMSDSLKGRKGTLLGKEAYYDPNTLKVSFFKENPGDPWVKGNLNSRKPKSETSKQKLSESKKGKAPWNKGIPRTQNEKDKIKATRNERSSQGLYDGLYDKTEDHKKKIGEGVSRFHQERKGMCQ